ncbi:response regulator [Sneathiella glossodoripedis]|uniref:response regulator n=1 Tax=Sneathiella glossodoripedis TaxID=418853 RepID=UPI00046F7611|nr:response regulator [Sneathiella glossodoripedis]
MAELDLSGFTILIVDDNSYMVRLLRQTLAGLGVGTIKTYTDAKEAIEFMKLVNENPVKAGVMQLDFIVSNWQMAPIDGLMFLRWVRTHKESPNRFIPFLMVTGFGDKAKVEESRDLGVSEVLAKPFSVNAVADKVMQIIGTQRQFVQTVDYFGPDRRRQNLPFKGDEKRILTDKHPEVKVIYE